MKNYHLVILKKPYLNAILAGQKTIESRFTITKRPPLGQISIGDKLFLKISSGPVCGTAAVADFQTFENLTPQKMVEIKRRYNQYVLGSDEYWKNKADCHFGTLIWLKNVKTINPVTINKKDWRAWVVLTEKQNFGLFGGNNSTK